MTSTKAQVQVAGGMVWCLAMGWFFATGRPVPLLALVDLGFHELGHFVTYVLPWELLTAAMGSVAQIGVPLGLAGYFAFGRRERVSAAVCLAWAATSARGVQVYIADAPFERLQLIGGDHDWAFILTELGHLDAAAGLARAVWVAGAAFFIASVALCASALGATDDPCGSAVGDVLTGEGARSSEPLRAGVLPDQPESDSPRRDRADTL